METGQHHHHTDRNRPVGWPAVGRRVRYEWWYQRHVPIFGISNQLLAAACFMLVTVCVAKLGYKKYLWIPVVPLVWDVAVTFTADFQKIVGPISYFATASSIRR